MTSAKINREDFRVKLDKLKLGITISWLINILLLTATLEAILIVVFLESTSTNTEIASFLSVTIPLSIVVGLFVTFLYSRRSWKKIILDLGLVETDDASQKYMENLVEEMSIAAGLHGVERPTVGVIPSPEPNAFALAGPEGTMIGITLGLMEICNREELQAIVAHELGHIISGDSKAMTKLIAMTSMAGLISGIGMRMMFFGGRRGGNRNSGKNPLAIALIVVSLIFLIFAGPLSRLAAATMQRKRESQADALSVRLTRNPSALANALRKIEASYTHLPEKEDEVAKSAQQLAFFSRKSYKTHPPTEERIQALKEMGADPTI